MQFKHLVKLWVQAWMSDRPLALGAAGGSASAIALRFLAELLAAPAPESVFRDCVCPELPDLHLGNLSLGSLDIPSVGLGICLGLAIGPVLDLLSLARATWRWWIRARLREVTLRSTDLYRLA